MGKSCLITNSVWGLGDAIWLIPCLKSIHKKYQTVYLETAWPLIYQGFPWIRVLQPSKDSEYSNWPMFKESIEAFDEWSELPEKADVIPVCETGDYSTRINSFYKFEGECDLSFPLKDEWISEAREWIEDIPKPRVLLHIPMHTPELSDPRYCDPQIFCEIFSRFEVGFFDIQRAVEQEPYVKIDMPILKSSSDKAYMLWGLTSLADIIVTTDNHMLPLALALKKKTLYLPGNVPIDYLFDKRIARSMVTISTDPYSDFERML